MVLSRARTKCLKGAQVLLKRARIPPQLLEATGQGLVDGCQPRAHFEICLAINHVGLRPCTMDEPWSLQDYPPSGLWNMKGILNNDQDSNQEFCPSVTLNDASNMH